MDTQQPAVWLEPSTASVRSGHVRIALAIPVDVVVAGVVSLREYRDDGFTAAVATAGILAILLLTLVVSMVRYWRTVRLYSERDILGRVDPLGKRHETLIENVGSVVALNLFGPYMPAREYWVFLDRAGHGLFMVNPAVWDREALTALLHRIGQQLQRGDLRPLSVYTVAKRYPGSFPWYLSRRWPIYVATVLLILTLSAIQIAVFGEHPHPSR